MTVFILYTYFWKYLAKKNKRFNWPQTKKQYIFANNEPKNQYFQRKSKIGNFVRSPYFLYTAGYLWE